MRVTVVLCLFLIAATPAQAASGKQQCSQLIQPIATLAAHYRSILDELEALPTNTMRAQLQDEELKLGTAAAESSVNLRAPLRDLVDRLDDFTYALQKCARLD